MPTSGQGRLAELDCLVPARGRTGLDPTCRSPAVNSVPCFLKCQRRAMLPASCAMLPKTGLLCLNRGRTGLDHMSANNVPSPIAIYPTNPYIRSFSAPFFAISLRANGIAHREGVVGGPRQVAGPHPLPAHPVGLLRNGLDYDVNGLDYHVKRLLTA